MGRPALGQRASGRGRGLKLPRVSPGLSPRLTEGHSPCTWDCWKLFPGAKWKFPATCRRHSRHPLRAWAGPGFPVAWGQPTARPGPPGPSPSRTLLTSKKPHLVDFQEAVHLAALVLLLLHLLAEALAPALLDRVWVLEGPASAAICLPHILAGVTAPAGEGAG